jgi:hypothetical protein
MIGCARESLGDIAKNLYLPRWGGGKKFQPRAFKFLKIIKAEVTLGLVVFGKSVRLGAKTLEVHDQSFFCNSTLPVIVLM